MKRNYKNEAAWAKKVYKVFTYKCRIESDDFKKLNKQLNGRPFSEWVREKLNDETK